MRAVVQRVSRASVSVDSQVVGRIERGFLVLLGVAEGDTVEDSDYLAAKVAELRVFEDSAGKMNLSLGDVTGSILAISQFTLLGDCRKGRRPSFSHAARPQLAQPLFERFVTAVRNRGIAVETGQFGAHMHVDLLNNGPVTLLLDSKESGKQ
jgi:D-tyrosyl-tRNA(Tyr) deacylase